MICAYLAPVLLIRDWFAGLSSKAPKSLFCPSAVPSQWGSSLDAETSPHLQLPARNAKVHPLPPLLFLFLSLFMVPSYM